MEKEKEERKDVPPGQLFSYKSWDDWQWQLHNRIETTPQLKQYIELSPEKEKEINSAIDYFKMAITPHFIKTVIASNGYRESLARIVIPQGEELKFSDADLFDPLDEHGDSPVPGLVHRYPDRVLLLTNNFCASYCRFCTRKRMVSKATGIGTEESLEAAFQYISKHKGIRDVIVSGGDPLILPDKKIDCILTSLRKIKHVEIIRIGTKVPVYLPQRINNDLLNILKKHHPLWMSINFVHHAEITRSVRAACARIADAGIPMASQTVLLRGINDCAHLIKKLMTELLKIRVRPYYLYQCDLSQGIEHFRTPVAKGIEIMEMLRGHISGYAVPTFVIDAPGGGGKIPVQPNYLISQGDGMVVLRNYEGVIVSYREPDRVDRTCTNTCRALCKTCTIKGVSRVLQGHDLLLRSEGETEVKTAFLGDGKQLLKALTPVSPAQAAAGNRKAT